MIINNGCQIGNVNKDYYENGQLKVVGKVSNNKQIGEWKYFYENGVLQLEKKFE